MAEADAVVHLAGALRPLGGNSYRSANPDTTRAVARALEHGKARRVLFLSYVGAAERSRNEYLRAKALAQRVLAASRKEIIVFRCTHIIGSPEAPGPTALAYALLLEIPHFVMQRKMLLGIKERAERALAIEGIGPLAALRAGWLVLRAHPGASLLVWLLNLVLGITAAWPSASPCWRSSSVAGFGAPTIAYLVVVLVGSDILVLRRTRADRSSRLG